MLSPVLMTSLACLALALGFAVMRPRGLPEATAAAPLAVGLILAGVLSGPHALQEAERVAPTLGFLATVLALGVLCADEGLFAWSGGVMARWARGSAWRLLLATFVLASLVTAVLSLDATVVLVTPVVIQAARAVGVDARPHLFATIHLANTASLLLPVSNLTNLLAYRATNLSFTGFAALMALPWLLSIGVELVVLRLFFARALGQRGNADVDPPAPPPAIVLGVVALTLIGFAVSSSVGIEPAWFALGAVIVLAIRRLRTGVHAARFALRLTRAANPLFLVFVLALAWIVRSVVDAGALAQLARHWPSGTGWGDLLAGAAASGAVANVVNNVPATLALTPVAAGGGATAVLAMLVGVNVGPNLTPLGSLATLLWRQVADDHEAPVSLRTFLVLGVWATPLVLVVATTALWSAAAVVGAPVP